MQDYLSALQQLEMWLKQLKNLLQHYFPLYININFNLKSWCLIKNNCQLSSYKYRKREACHNAQYRGISQQHETNYYKHPLLP